MTIHAYLKKTEVEQHPKFEKKVLKTSQGESTRYELDTITLCRENSRWYMYINNLRDPLPEVVLPLVEVISVQEYLPLSIVRESGIYRHGSAEAEVTQSLRAGERQMWTEIRGTTQEDVLTLWNSLKAGTIRPEVSYEGPQGGHSRADLISKVAFLEGEVERLEELCDSNSMRRGNLEDKARFLLERLKLVKIFISQGRTPWVRRSRVLTMIQETFPESE